MNDTTDERSSLLHTWISEHYRIEPNSFTSVSGDASFRRYFRFNNAERSKSNNHSLIAVDAPPDLENSQPFIDIAQLLINKQIAVPKIYEYDLKLGFYILQDFGDQLLLDALDTKTVDDLYISAMKNIADMQSVDCSHLPLYDTGLLQREMKLFTDWYLKKHLKIDLSQEQTASLDNCYQLLVTNALEQPQVFVHRDYHSRNLMLLDQKKLGIIDFQDAVKGPITYDLVSLLRDCYISWPEEKVNQWLKYFHENFYSHLSLQTFIRWFDLMGVQRHLKATGIFCRLNYRDNKSKYLNDIPRTLNYIKRVSKKYPELRLTDQLLINI